ncbi:hypothetical protein F4779DRAFT_567290 [Xylariaceae sp. FL0662B]|nr:hypothetical protein F4779DRAFT_567290 [Xylariaceae sp. FL0662B]
MLPNISIIVLLATYVMSYILSVVKAYFIHPSLAFIGFHDSSLLQRESQLPRSLDKWPGAPENVIEAICRPSSCHTR